MVINKENIQIIFFGVPPVGFSTFPESKSKYYEAVIRPKEDEPIEAKIYNTDSKSTFLYIKHGFSGENNRGEKRSGRSLGIAFELEGYRFKQNDSILSVLQPKIKQFYSENEIIVNKQFQFNSFKDVSELLEEYQKKFRKIIRNEVQVEIISPEYEEKVDLINIGKKIVTTSDITYKSINISKDKMKDTNYSDKIRMVEERISELEKKNKSLFRYIPIIWLLLLTLFGTYQFIKNNSNRSKRPKQEKKMVPFKSKESKQNTYSSNEYVSVKIKDSKTQFFLVPDKFSNKSDSPIKNMNQFYSEVSKYFRIHYLKNKVNLSDNDIQQFIRNENSESNTSIEDRLEKSGQIDRATLRDLIGNNYLIYQI